MSDHVRVQQVSKRKKVYLKTVVFPTPGDPPAVDSGLLPSWLLWFARATPDGRPVAKSIPPSISKRRGL